MSKHRLEVLERLADTVGERAGAAPGSSYTAKLLSQGGRNAPRSSVKRRSRRRLPP
jgi:phosphoribosyl-ATP pyrophosphohydrolase